MDVNVFSRAAGRVFGSITSIPVRIGFEIGIRASKAFGSTRYLKPSTGLMASGTSIGYTGEYTEPLSVAETYTVYRHSASVCGASKCNQTQPQSVTVVANSA